MAKDVDFVEAMGRKIKLYPEMIKDLPAVVQTEFGELLGSLAQGRRKAGMSRAASLVYLFCLFTHQLPRRERLDGDEILNDQDAARNESRRYTNEQVAEVITGGVKIASYLTDLFNEAATEAEQDPNAQEELKKKAPKIKEPIGA